MLDKVASMLGRLALGVRLLGSLTVLAGLAILAGAVSAGSIRRGAEVALLKTLGVTRAGIGALLIEVVQQVKGGRGVTIEGFPIGCLKIDPFVSFNDGAPAIYEIVEVSGGIQAFTKALDRKPPGRLVVISVNASTNPEPEMDKSNKQPSLKESIGAVSSVQLHLYNTATLELMNNTLPRWAKALSTPERAVEPHFIQVGFNDIDKPDLLEFFNLIPTSFDLSDEQVDELIKAGRQLIRENPDFQGLLAEQRRASAK